MNTDTVNEKRPYGADDSLTSTQATRIDWDDDDDDYIEPAEVPAEFLFDRDQYVKKPTDLGIQAFATVPNGSDKCYEEPEWFSGNLYLSDNDLRNLAANCHVTDVVAGLAYRPDLPDDAWDSLLARPSEYVRRAILHSPFAPERAKIEATLRGPWPAGTFAPDYSEMYWQDQWIEDYLPEGVGGYEEREGYVEVFPGHPEYDFWR